MKILSRPNLTSQMDELEFNRWYWLKAELIAYCREANLPMSGSKGDLVMRIAAHLGKRPEPIFLRPLTSASDTAPEVLTIDTVVIPGFRLSRKLRAFFDKYEYGFRFNQALRDFFKAPAGRTLGDALNIYRTSRSNKANKEISDQFEYNKHIREFFECNKSAAMHEARAAWWEKRLKPRD